METNLSALPLDLGDPDPDHPGPWGVSPGWYTAEWAASKGLSLTCERCGLPFDRTGGIRHTPVEIIASGYPPRVNTHCPRFIGRDEMWDCIGKRVA